MNDEHDAIFAFPIQDQQEDIFYRSAFLQSSIKVRLQLSVCTISLVFYNM